MLRLPQGKLPSGQRELKEERSSSLSSTRVITGNKIQSNDLSATDFSILTKSETFVSARLGLKLGFTN